MSSNIPENMVTIGKVIAPHGIKGELRIYPYSDILSRCYELKKVWLKDKSSDLFFVRQVESAGIHKRMWRLKLEGVNNRAEAEAMLGYLVEIPASERVSLPQGRYYFDQIIGLRVYEKDGSYLGEVIDVLQPGGNDIYIVKTGNSQVLVPAVKQVVRKISLTEGLMHVELPPGLKEL